MDKLIVLGMGIPYSYPTHGYPYLGVGSNAWDLITCHNDDIRILLATCLMPTQSFLNHDNKFALLALLLKWHEPTQHEFVTWITVSL